MGFKSVDGYQRAFQKEFNCNPYEYSKNPIPIYLFNPYGVKFINMEVKMIYGEILAGGSGTRMGNTEMPKQFLMLGDRPIIIHTIEQFLINQSFSKIVVCCPKEWVSYAEDLLEKYNIDTERVEVTAGGATRNDTIINGCKLIEEKYGLTDKDVIVTHDAVRPFVNQRILDDNIKAAKKYDAVDTVIPATDTIVYSKDGKIITEIPDRKECYQERNRIS